MSFVGSVGLIMKGSFPPSLPLPLQMNASNVDKFAVTKLKVLAAAVREELRSTVEMSLSRTAVAK